MTNDKAIEAAARSEAEFDGKDWPTMGRVNRERYMERCRAALAALKAGDVLPGDGSGRLVVVREVADRPPVPTATPGRYAKCIDNNGSKIRLTIGKTYEVVEERLDAFGHFYRVLNDMNREEDFRAARFEPIAKELPHD